MACVSLVTLKRKLIDISQHAEFHNRTIVMPIFFLLIQNNRKVTDGERSGIFLALPGFIKISDQNLKQ